MILQKIIDTYEELKKYSYIIKCGDKGNILITFKNGNFYHLIGLHKTKINMFIPNDITSKSNKYKYIKKNVKKFNEILLSEMKENLTLQYRINTFYKIVDLLKGENTSLYNLKPKLEGSLYDGDYGLLKIYEEVNCLLGLIIDDKNNNTIKCAPQSWMASNRINSLIKNRKPIYKEMVICIPNDMIDNINNLVTS